MPLVQFSDMVNASTSAQVASMNSYLTYPMITLVFGVVAAITGIYVIFRMVMWVGHKMANLPNAGTSSKSNHWDTNQYRH